MLFLEDSDMAVLLSAERTFESVIGYLSKSSQKRKILCFHECPKEQADLWTRNVWPFETKTKQPWKQGKKGYLELIKQQNIKEAMFFQLSWTLSRSA